MSPAGGAGLIAPGWLLTVARDGLVAVGPDDEIEIELAVTPERRAGAIDAIAGGDQQAVAEAASLNAADADELLGALRAAGVLLDRVAADPSAGHSLMSAIESRSPGHGSEIVWTAEEALVLPSAIADDQRDATLRAFIAGMQPDARLQAYAALLHGRGHVAGDRPAAPVLDERLTQLQADPDSIAVVELDPEGRTWQVPVDRLDSLDASGEHRLGPITRVIAGGSFAAEGMPDIHFTIAEVADANLARPAREIDRRTQGVGSAELSELVARAEGAERFAISGPGAGAAELRLAEAGELEGAIAPSELFSFNARQLRSHGPSDDSGERWWCAGETYAGERRWLPAELVFTGAVGEPAGTPLPGTSSGVAAHTDRMQARNSALGELIERDAFMWTWIQQLSRELVDPAGLPADVAAWSAALASNGWTARWVNLTLETQPAILCCLTHAQRGLVLGASSRPDAAAALRRATLEALVLALRFRPRGGEAVDPRQAHSPVDHLQLHMDPTRELDHGFLYSSNERIDLAEIIPAADPVAALDVLGIEPVFVDLDSDRTQPFHVVRAAAPGLIPLSFGWDREPLGMPLLGGPRARPDGSLVGRRLALSEALLPVPHPFP